MIALESDKGMEANRGSGLRHTDYGTRMRLSSTSRSIADRHHFEINTAGKTIHGGDKACG
jgi:hypothetical protein